MKQAFNETIAGSFASPVPCPRAPSGQNAAACIGKGVDGLALLVVQQHRGAEHQHTGLQTCNQIRTGDFPVGLAAKSSQILVPASLPGIVTGAIGGEKGGCNRA